MYILGFYIQFFVLSFYFPEGLTLTVNRREEQGQEQEQHPTVNRSIEEQEQHPTVNRSKEEQEQHSTVNRSIEEQEQHPTVNKSIEEQEQHSTVQRIAASTESTGGGTYREYLCT